MTSLSVDREREHAKPIEGAAEAIYGHVEPLSGDQIGVVLVASEHLFPTRAHQTGNSQSKAYELAAMDICKTAAQAAWDYYVAHGWITDLGLEAMKKERGME